MEIPMFKVFMAEDAPELVSEVLSSGYVGQGPKVDQLEESLSQFIGSPYVVTVNSGTSALHLALHMIKEDDGRDEVLTTPLTCTATNFPILANGLKLKWVDVDPQTFNMDLNDLRRKISPKTRAIMVVHWGGYPLDLDALKNIQDDCERLYGFRPPIIEDCAHAMGAKYKGKLLGNHGNICMFSFQAIKHFTTVDGGMLVLPNDMQYQRAKLLRWFGLDRTRSADFRCEQNIEEWGYKFQMNDMTAAVGIKNLPHLNRIISKHRKNGIFFDNNLGDIKVPGVISVQQSKFDHQSSYWVYTMRVDNRDGFMRKMKEQGIAVSRVHDRNDKHECLKEFRSILPNTDVVCDSMCCIPCGWWVEKEHREYILDCIKKGW